MKKMIGIRLMLTIAAALMVWSATTALARAQDLKVRFAWYMPPHTAIADQANAITREIQSLSKGKIQVETYPSGSLLNESNIAQGVQNNTTNMATFSMHWWSKVEPSLAWDTIPFRTGNAAALLKALHGKLGQDVNKVLNKHGVVIIGWGFYGYAKSYINNKRPILLPADLKGLRMRSEGLLNAMFLRSQGATPVAVDSSEVYTAIQRGTLDGATSGLSSFISRKWYEVGKYITAIHYEPLVYPVQANLHWWKGLTKEQRRVISKACALTEKTSVAQIEKEFNKDIAIAKKNGNIVDRPTPAQLKKWKAITESMAEKNYIAMSGNKGKMFIAALEAALGH